MLKKTKGGRGVPFSMYWGTGCTFPVCSLAVIKDLKVEVMPLTQDLMIEEASGSKLEILGQP